MAKNKTKLDTKMLIIIGVIVAVAIIAVVVLMQPSPRNSSGGDGGTPTPIVGGDRDEHGCIGSAGYSWCEPKQKCLRIWEENCTSSGSDSILRFNSIEQCDAECKSKGYTEGMCAWPMEGTGKENIGSCLIEFSKHCGNKGQCNCYCGNACVPNETAICTMDYTPVCGTDGKTYGNRCVAKAACADVAYGGECNSTIGTLVQIT